MLVLMMVVMTILGLFVLPLNHLNLWFKLVVVVIMVKIMMVVIMRMTSTLRFVWLNMKTSKLSGNDDGSDDDDGDGGGEQIVFLAET